MDCGLKAKSVGSVCPKTHPVFIFSVPECIISIGTLRSLQNSHTGSLISGVRTILVKKVKWKPLELPPQEIIVN